MTLGSAVWDVIAHLSHQGEETLDPHSIEAVELRETAYNSVGKTGDEKNLAFAALEWLQGMISFESLKQASQT